MSTPTTAGASAMDSTDASATSTTPFARRRSRYQYDDEEEKSKAISGSAPGVIYVDQSLLRTNELGGQFLKLSEPQVPTTTTAQMLLRGYRYFAPIPFEDQNTWLHDDPGNEFVQPWEAVDAVVDEERNVPAAQVDHDQVPEDVEAQAAEHVDVEVSNDVDTQAPKEVDPQASDDVDAQASHDVQAQEEEGNAPSSQTRPIEISSDVEISTQAPDVSTPRAAPANDQQGPALRRSTRANRGQLKRKRVEEEDTDDEGQGAGSKDEEYKNDEKDDGHAGTEEPAPKKKRFTVNAILAKTKRKNWMAVAKRCKPCKDNGRQCHPSHPGAIPVKGRPVEDD